MNLQQAIADAKQIEVNFYPMQGIQVAMKVSKNYFRTKLSLHYELFLDQEGEPCDEDDPRSETVWYGTCLGEIVATYYPIERTLLLGS
tara:strand:+ start:34 stop:297 length:264 start_codon:yes stop_codon:yes gene_type:complete